MKTRIGLQPLIAFALVAVLNMAMVVKPVSGAELQAGASRYPWTAQTFVVDTDATALSTVFGGPDEMLSIVSSVTYMDSPTISFFNKWLDACGPGDDWYCEYVTGTDFNSSTLSAVAEYTYTNSYKLAVAYEKSDHWVYLLTREFASDGEPVYMNEEPIFYTSPSYSVFGRPSVAFDEYGDAHVTLVNRYGARHILMYIHETSTANSSCGSTLNWQCDVILNVAAEMIGSQPTIVMNSSNSARILFYYGSSRDLTLAYPKSALLPGTCGPDNSWRCVTISENVQFDSDMDMAIDLDSSQPHLAWTYTDELNQTWAYHAQYVGSYGNCGYDAAYNPISHSVYYVYRWECHQVGLIGLNAMYEYVSIAVDGDNNPVMAFNSDNGYSYDLYVAYGVPGDSYSYEFQKVDGNGINTGKQVDLSLDESGRGFLAYIEDREYEPTLRIAYQEYYTFQPLIMR